VLFVVTARTSSMGYKDPEKQKAYLAAHYENNKGKYIESSKAARMRKKAKLAKIKDKPCLDCGVKYPHYVMEFDHISDNKVASIADLMMYKAWQTVLDEIAKCELVCANCHRARTYRRLLDNDPMLAV
jgi:hypothetical protein